MTLKNPSDFFEEGKKESIVEKLVERPELKSFSDAFNVYKENISKFDNLSETLKNIENIQSDIKDFIKKEDLDNATISYAFLLEETVSKLKDDVKGINEKHLIKIRSNVSSLAEKINNFVEVEAPKYKKSILESEIKSSDRYEKFKNDTDIVLEDIAKYITNNEEKTEENITSLNETLDKVVEDLEKKINLISDNKDTIFQNLSKKITEVKNLKKSINKDLKVYEDHKNNVEDKISDLEVEIVRSKSNLKENLKKQNEEFVKVQKNVKTNFNSIRKEFKTVVDKLNLDNLEEKNNELSKKVRYLEEVFAKFNEKEFLSEGLLNIPPETKNSDPLTPLNKDFVTLDQLQNHYRLFLNRIQQQLATFGGGGETQLKYLDDVVGIATNPAAYDGGYLRYVHSLKKFAFSSPSDGDTWIQGVDGPYTMGRVGIGTSLIQSGDYPGNALVVDGNARFTGIVSIGTSSITLNAETGQIAAGDVEVVSPGGGANFVGVITAGGANFTGDVSIGGTLTYEDVKNVDSIGIITANKDVRVGRNFNVTGLSTFTGITTFSDDVYVGGDLNIIGDIVYDEVSGRNLNVSGVSTVNNLIVSGISSFTSTSHTKLPSGTTAQRPASAIVGDIRYNTQTNEFEGYKGSSPSWGALGGGGGTPGGSNTQIQFNDSDSFEGDANLTFDGSKLAVGVDLDVDGHTELDDVNVSGVATIGNVTVGGATTDLLVEGDARVTGILTIGTSSLTLDGSTNKINVGSATTIESTGYRIGNSFVHSTGISADSIDAAISEWVLTTNPFGGNSAYEFTGPGNLDKENDPTIYLKRGQKYRFKNTMGAHPFRIQSTVNGSTGTQYNDGITNNDVSDGTLIWDVQFDTPDVLYYQCTAHPNMGGKIYIGNSGDSSTLVNLNVDGHTELDDVNVSGVSTFSDEIYIASSRAINFAPVGSGGRIKHHSSNLLIDETVGNIQITNHADDKDVDISSDDGSGGTALYFRADGSTGESILYNYGTEKIKTTTDGIDVTGHVETDTLHVSGICTATTFSGSGTSLTSIPNSALDNSTVSFGGIELALGAVDANPAFNLTDATNYPYASLTGIVTHIVGDTTPQLGGNLDLNSKDITGTGNINITGDVSIGGTLTYEDVTNIDSVGLITARSGIKVTSGGINVASGIVTATTFDAESYHMVSGGTRDKYRFWDNNSWIMGMDDGMSFGGLNSYAITSQVTNHDDRGWVFLDASHTDAQGAMSLNTIGELVVAKSIRAGGGESDTSAPRKPLDIVGDGIISGQAGIGTNYVGDAQLRVYKDGLDEILQQWGGTQGATAGARYMELYTPSSDNANDYFRFQTGNAIKFRIDSKNALCISANGNIGFGTDNPGQEIDIWSDTPCIQLKDTSPYEAGSYGQIAQSGNVLQLIADSGTGDSHGSIFFYCYNDSDTLNSYRISDNVHQWYTASSSNSEKMRLDDAGHVGINSTGPNTMLDVIASSASRTWTPGTSVVSMFERVSNSRIAIVAGSSSYSEIDFGDSTDDNAGYIRYDHIDDSMSFRTDTDEQLRITSDGKVGIGLTNPQSALEVAADAAVLTITDTRSQTFSVGDIMSSLAFDTDDASGGAGSTSHPRAKINLVTENTFGSATGLSFATKGDNSNAPGEKLRITSDGKVGIGLTNPSVKLDVNGTTKATTFSGSGANLTSLPGGELTGIVTAARLASNGTADSSTFLRGDGSWAAAGGGGFSQDDQGNLVAGTGAGPASDNANTIYNVSIGCNAGANLTTGDCNTFIGHNAGQYSTTSGLQVYIGRDAGKMHKDNQDYNIAIGYAAYACGNYSTSKDNVVIGRRAALWGIGDYNIALGNMAAACQTLGDHNIAMGHCALVGSATTTNNSGSDNIVLGCKAANYMTSGSDNIVMGSCSMGGDSITGSYNISFGNFAGKDISSGHSNVFIGKCAGQCATNAPSNVVLGPGAVSGATFTGDENVVAGFFAGCSLAGGNYNVMLGSVAGRNVAGGSRNFLGGYAAGDNITSGSYNVIIGSGVDAGSATGDNQFIIGCGSSHWITGDSSFNIYDKDGNQLNGGGGGADVGVSSNTNYIGTGVTNFNFVGTGITASLTAGASANTVANVYIPTAVRTTNRYIATADQTTFSATYTVGHVDVFLNGIKLDGQDEFTATNGTSVVLTDGATVNDIVEIVAQQISANLTITGIENVVEDTTPQLGGNLDVNGKLISGTGDVNLTGIVTATTFSGGTFSGNVDLSGLLKEGVNITAGKLSDNLNIDLANGMVHLFTTTEDATALPNIVFGGSSVNAKMSTGEAITVVIIVTAAAAGFAAQLQVDGSGVTEQWLGGTVPSAGGSDGYDVYTHNIIKTADATFVVLSNLVNFT